MANLREYPYAVEYINQEAYKISKLDEVIPDGNNAIYENIVLEFKSKKGLDKNGESLKKINS